MAATSHSAASSTAPSPGVGAVPLSSAIGDLLRFVLAARAAATDDPAFPLSPSYCTRLLNDGDLFAKLAAGIVRCIEEGRMPSSPAAVGVPVAEVEGSQEREREWDTVMREKGAEVKQMYDGVDFELHVQEPYFTLLKAESKTVEGRLATAYFDRFAQGSLLLFNKCLLLNVEALTKYTSFSEMLQIEILSNVLPGVSSVEEGIKVYRKFYTEEKEKEFGVLAISVSKPPAQPYTTMTDILDRLGYDGVGRLLGMGKTAGTIPDGLPPPRSTLMSSSMNLNQPHVRGCSLTNAARALAKHVPRTLEGWWGRFDGSDLSKNQLAFEAIECLLRECCWMNVHLTQPHGPVFEIRVHEGYGARWSQDGSKFIGFLEPYTPEGFSKGWKH